jgi:hypothetical protein
MQLTRTVFQVATVTEDELFRVEVRIALVVSMGEPVVNHQPNPITVELRYAGGKYTRKDLGSGPAYIIFMLSIAHSSCETSQNARGTSRL